MCECTGVAVGGGGAMFRAGIDQHITGLQIENGAS